MSSTFLSLEWNGSLWCSIGCLVGRNHISRIGERNVSVTFQPFWEFGLFHKSVLFSYPYPGGSEFEILSALLQMPAPSLTVEEGFSPEFCDFVKLCLNKDVEQRPKYDVLMVSLKATYVNQRLWKILA